MPSSPSPAAPVAKFICARGFLARTSCIGLPFYREHEGKRYCVLHYPNKDKVADFDVALKRKLDAEDFYFGGVWFPVRVDFFAHAFTKPVNFADATFADVADFCSAKFNAEASFVHASFRSAAVFGHAVFGMEANFTGATFQARADFTNSSFKEEAHYINSVFDRAADFRYSVFSKRADFYRATFKEEANFSDATFSDYLRLSGTLNRQVFGSRSSLSLQHARVEKPERVSFHSLTLRPHWFVNVDARKFEFINVNWSKINIGEELKGLGDWFASPHRLLAVACRNLAVNAEENHRYEEASMFR